MPAYNLFRHRRKQELVCAVPEDCVVPGGCVAWIRGVGALTPAPSRLGDADVVRASQVQHAVEHVDGHVHLGGPTLLGVRAQPVPDHALEPADHRLGPGSFRVAAVLLLT
jgi:hypothetical protein